MSLFTTAWSALLRAGAVFAKPVELPGDSATDDNGSQDSKDSPRGSKARNDSKGKRDVDAGRRKGTSPAATTTAAIAINSTGAASPKRSGQAVSRSLGESSSGDFGKTKHRTRRKDEPSASLKYDARALTEKTMVVWSRPLAKTTIPIDLPRLASMTTIRVNGVVFASPAAGITPEGPPADAPVFVILYALAKILDGDKLAARIDEELPLAVPSLCVPRTVTTQAIASAASGSFLKFLDTVVGEDSRTVAVLRGCTQGTIAPSVGTLYALCVPTPFFDAGSWFIEIDIADSGGDLEVVITHHKRQRGRPIPGTDKPKFEFEWSLALYPLATDLRTLDRCVLAIDEIIDNTPADLGTVEFLQDVQTELLLSAD